MIVLAQRNLEAYFVKEFDDLVCSESSYSNRAFQYPLLESCDMGNLIVKDVMTLKCTDDSKQTEGTKSCNGGSCMGINHFLAMSRT